MRRVKIAEGKFKSSHYLIWKDSKGEVHKGLFADKKQATKWWKAN
jgi:hypothetical protein